MKLSQKAALLDLIVAPEMDLAGEKVVERWRKGGGKVEERWWKGGCEACHWCLLTSRIQKWPKRAHLAPLAGQICHLSGSFSGSRLPV